MRSGWKTLLLAILALLATANGIGFIAGVFSSPRYDNTTSAFQYMIAHARFELNETRLERISIVAGPRRFDFDPTAESLVEEATSTIEALQLKPPRRDVASEIDRILSWTGISAAVPGGLAGAATVIAVQSRTPPLLARMSSRSYARLGRSKIGVLALGGIASGYYGYTLGYTDTADYDNRAFLDTLRNVAFYNSLAESFRVCQEVFPDSAFLDINLWASSKPEWRSHFVASRTFTPREGDDYKRLPVDQLREEYSTFCGNLKTWSYGRDNDIIPIDDLQRLLEM